MKAAAADQLRLLDVQALDTRLDQLAHRRRDAARASPSSPSSTPGSPTLRDQLVRRRDRAERPRTAS